MISSHLLLEVFMRSPHIFHSFNDVCELSHFIVGATVIVSRILAPVLGMLVLRQRHLNLLEVLGDSLDLGELLGTLMHDLARELLKEGRSYCLSHSHSLLHELFLVVKECSAYELLQALLVISQHGKHLHSETSFLESLDFPGRLCHL